MAGRYDQQKRPGAKAVKQPENAAQGPEEQAPELELDRELASQEQAQQVGSAVGNADLQKMLNESGQVGRESELQTGLEQDAGNLEAEEGLAEYLEGVGGPLHLSAGVGTSAMERLLGGDPEDEGPPLPPRVHFSRRNRIPRARANDQEDTPIQEIEDLLDEELPPLGEAGVPQGDERLDALWSWMQKPSAFAAPQLPPETLAARPGVHERPRAMGAFLRRHAASPLARWLARLARPLPGPAQGASLLARAALMAELAAHAEARLRPLDVVNRACAMALESDVGPRSRRAARLCLEKRQLRGPLVLEVALQGAPLPAGTALASPGPGGLALLQSALEFCAQPLPIVPPGRHAQPLEADASADDSTEAIDALMAHLLGGEAAPTMSEERLAPVLDGADDLLLIAGRAQIELAAAAIAVRRAAGSLVATRVAALLKATDRELRTCAKEVSAVAEAVDNLVNVPYARAQAPVQAAETMLEALAARIQRLRDAALGTLAWASTGRVDSSSPVAHLSLPLGAPGPFTELLTAVEDTPLLGRGLEQARRLEAQAFASLLPSTPQAEKGRLLLRQGQRLLAQGHPAAPERLANATAALERAGSPLAQRARIEVVRAMAQRGRLADARALFARCAPQAAPLHHALAALALGEDLALSRVREHLHTGPVELQAAAHSALAEALADTGRHDDAQRHLLALRALAQDHGDPAHQAVASLGLLANALLGARPLQPHLGDAMRCRDRLVAMAALAVCPPTPWTTGLLASHALQHRNWTAWQLAVIDAHRALSPRDPQLAKSLLVGGLSLLRERGEPGALLQARVLEVYALASA